MPEWSFIKCSFQSPKPQPTKIGDRLQKGPERYPTSSYHAHAGECHGGKGIDVRCGKLFQVHLVDGTVDELEGFEARMSTCCRERVNEMCRIAGYVYTTVKTESQMLQIGNAGNELNGASLPAWLAASWSDQ